MRPKLALWFPELNSVQLDKLEKLIEQEVAKAKGEARLDERLATLSSEVGKMGSSQDPSTPTVLGHEADNSSEVA